MKKRRSVLTAVLLLATLLLPACGNGGASSGAPAADSGGAQASSQTEEAPDATADSGDSAKLNIWIAGTGEPIVDQAYTTVFDNYVAQNPGVDYEITYIAWGDYFTKLNTGLIGGAGPDLFMTGYGQFGTVHSTGDLLALNDYIPADWEGFDDIADNVLQAGVKDGEYFGLFMPSSRVLLYRKDIAEENGVTEEDLHIASMDDFVSLVEKMTVRDDSGNVATYGMEFDPDGEQHFYFMSSMLDTGFQLWDDGYNPLFHNASAVQAWQKAVDLYNDGVACLQDAGAPMNGVQSGVASMTIQPESAYATADEAFPGQIGIVKNDMGTLLIGDYFAVNSATAYPEIATDMLLHLFSRESAQIQMELRGYYFARASLDADYVALNPEFEKVVHAYERSTTYGKACYPNFNAAVTPLRTNLEAPFHGADVQASLDTAEAEWNAVNEG